MYGFYTNTFMNLQANNYRIMDGLSTDTHLNGEKLY
jgi:hypothetical protein